MGKKWILTLSNSDTFQSPAALIQVSFFESLQKDRAIENLYWHFRPLQNSIVFGKLTCKCSLVQ